jgi:hypothetical protein
MAEHRRSARRPVPSLEAVLLDIVRLAAKNDAAGITRRVRRWVGSPAARREGLTEALRGEILAALQATPDSRQTTHLDRGSLETFKAHPEADPSPEPTLAPPARQAMRRIIAEYESHESLAARGLPPTRSLLLSGPPGVGKTMTAAWIADQLALPLLSIEPSEIVTSLLGDSARNLTRALREAQHTPCVVLLDEIDAFGKSRDDPHDVGELKRLVTTLLVELDRWPAGKLIIGATNHPALLDHALERRFERRVALTTPGAEERATIIGALLAEHEALINPGTLRTLLTLTEGASGSRLSGIVKGALRNTILEDEPLQLALMREALPSDPESLPRATRASFARAANEHARLSRRAIAQLLGCSHTTVGRLLDPCAIVQAA